MIMIFLLVHISHQSTRFTLKHFVKILSRHAPPTWRPTPPQPQALPSEIQLLRLSCSHTASPSPSSGVPPYLLLVKCQESAAWVGPLSGSRLVRSERLEPVVPRERFEGRPAVRRASRIESTACVHLLPSPGWNSVTVSWLAAFQTITWFLSVPHTICIPSFDTTMFSTGLPTTIGVQFRAIFYTLEQIPRRPTMCLPYARNATVHISLQL